MKRKSMFSLLPVLCAALLSLSDARSAMLVNSYSNGETLFNDTVGYQFTVGSLDLNISALGVQWPSGGLFSANKVGLWTVGGTLLASVNIAPNSTPVSGYAWASLVSPVRLNALTPYVVGVAGSTSGDYRHSGLATLSSDVTLIGPARNSQQFVFSAPTLISGLGGQAIVGPNLTYETVPEPSTHALLLLSGAASLWALKRRKS